MPRSRFSFLCLGDPMVDLVSESPARELAEAGSFAPHPGGAAANVAAVAARAGASVRLAGALGGDEWGSWLRARLERAGVDTEPLAVQDGEDSPLAFVTVDERGEATYRLAGGQRGFARLAAEHLEAALATAGGLFLCSNTLVGEPERALTMGVRERALAAGQAVVFDANLRLHRWRSRSDAAASANACVPGALLVRANLAEASLMTGEEDPERAAAALLKAGARLVVLSLGGEGAILRGELRAEAPAPRVEVRSTLGAGDVLTGELLTRLAQSGGYPPAAAAGLRDAVARASAACARWGALD